MSEDPVLGARHRVGAREVLDALASRHAQDLYAEEVSVEGQATARLDAWAAPRSWTQWETTGYEVKVARGDWLADTKMHLYAEHVHRLWVVCPWQMIAVEEVPPYCGLAWLTRTGGRVLRKKPAPRLDPPADRTLAVLQSLLINRVRMNPRGGLGARTRREQLDALDLDRRERLELGHIIGGRVREIEEEARQGRVLRRDREIIDSDLKAAGFTSLRDALRAVRVSGCRIDGQAALDALERLRDDAGRAIARLTPQG